MQPDYPTLEKLRESTSGWLQYHVPGIYSVTCLDNGRVYVGQSAYSVLDRWAEHSYHLSLGRHRSPIFQASYNAHGSSSFICRLLESIQLTGNKDLDRARLISLEQKWMCVTGAITRQGFNVCPFAGTCYGLSRGARSEDHRERLSLALQGNQNAIGWKLTDEQRAKMSLASTGNQRAAGHVPSQERRKEISALHTGNKYCEGKVCSVEKRAAIAAKLTGRKQSEESKQKKSEASKAMWEKRRQQESRGEADPRLSPS